MPVKTRMPAYQVQVGDLTQGGGMYVGVAWVPELNVVVLSVLLEGTVSDVPTRPLRTRARATCRPS